jgi:ppGpp synthetase/RelA/SpoT-type nucleotidyltranferase
VSPQIEEFSTVDLWIEPSKEEQILAGTGISKKQIKRAGEILASDADSEAKSEAYAIVEKWRASHTYILRAVHTLLTGNARRINQWAFTSGRLKRMDSIAFKLQRQQGKMDLNQMNDVAGCRAVLWQVEQVPKLLARLEKHFVLGGPFKPRLYDYIQSPKPDGYRGIHLAVQYQSKNPKHVDSCGKRVEIQIRSTLQHAWATAVETVDLFANEKLKLGQGNKQWSRFFALTSSIFAKKEKSPPVPETPASDTELIEELRALWKALRVPHLLAGWMTAVGYASSPLPDANYLLTVDTNQRTLKITPFGPPYVIEANAAYAAVEEEDRDNPDRNSVLVSVDKIVDLKEAFPNYYADTRDFLKELREALKDYSNGR